LPRPSISQKELLHYARAGAEARIQELRAELAALEKAFGKGSGRRAGAASGRAAKGRRKGTMSAEGRQRIAEAARKRWAKWRAEKAASKKK